MQTDVIENSLPGQLFDHFGLRENPFGVTPDIRFLYQSQTHREALTSLINGIDFGFGFQVLIGQPGMGKTSLLFSLLERFRTTAQTAFLFQPQSEPHDLLQSMLYELGMSSTETSLHKLFEQVNEVLYRASRERKRVILVVDEAQNLDFVVLEALRQLSNFETPDAKLLQVVLAGQPQLAEKLAASTHEQLRQRISAISRLRPLGLDETAAYIHHRLTTAGYSGTDLFREGGVRLIWNRSKGVPRNINTLCFGAMMLGFAEGTKAIDEPLLEEAARDLDLNSALADVFAMEPPAKVSRGNGRILPIGKTMPPTADIPTATSGANEEPVASAGVVLHEAGTVTTSGRNDDRAPGGASEYISPAVVEALARITQALDEQKLLLAANTVTLAQPLSVPPVIPSQSAAEEDAKISVRLDSAPPLEDSTAIESGAAAILREPVTRLETNSPLTTAEKELPGERKSAADLVSELERKAPVKQSLVPDSPAVPGSPVAAQEWKESRMARTRALSFAALAGILVLMLVEKFPLHLGADRARVLNPSTVVREAEPVDYPLPRSPAPPIIEPSSAGTNTSTDLHGPELHNPRARRSGRARDVVVRTYSTDLSVTSKTSDNREELRRVFFNENSDSIDSQYRPWLQQLADALAKDPTAVVNLEGHTDGLGGEGYNRNLSSRRALAVRNALINELHVPKTRLVATGVGSDAPLQPNSSATGRAYNRRVEVRLTHSSN